MLDDIEVIDVMVEVFASIVVVFGVHLIAGNIIVVGIKKVNYLRRCLRLSGGTMGGVYMGPYSKPMFLRSGGNSTLRYTTGRIRKTKTATAVPKKEQRDLNAPTKIVSGPIVGSYKKQDRVVSMMRTLSSGLMYTLNYYYMERSPTTIGSQTFTAPVSGTCTVFEYATGRGPSLFSETYTSLPDYTDPEFLSHDDVIPFYTATTSINAAYSGYTNPAYFPLNSVAYWFVADWLFQTMNPNSLCQTTAHPDNYQAFKEDNGPAPNDPLAPFKFSTINANLDWTHIQVLGTRYYMTFENFHVTDMRVEVLFYKYIADFDSIGVNNYYTSHLNAPFCYLTNAHDMYTRQHKTKGYGTPQIRVIKRDRFTLSAPKLDFTYVSTNVQTYSSVSTGSRKSMATKVYDITRKYSVTRSTNLNVSPATEPDFFNLYYDKDTGIYCRVEAWPVRNSIGFTAVMDSTAQPVAIANSMNLTSAIRRYATPFTMSTGSIAITPNLVMTTGIVRQGVSCKVVKRTFFQTDSPILKGPFRS